MTTEGLPPEAPRTGTIVTIDVSTNQAYLFRDGELIRKSAAATGSDKVLRKGNRVWWFRTPRGRHTVVRKVVDPVWTKPDWAFIEEGKPVPPHDSPKRKEKGTIGLHCTCADAVYRAEEQGRFCKHIKGLLHAGASLARQVTVSVHGISAA